MISQDMVNISRSKIRKYILNFFIIVLKGYYVPTFFSYLVSGGVEWGDDYPIPKKF